MTDVASISQYTQANIASQVSMKVAAKAKDVAEQQGEAVISLLQEAADLSKSLSAEPGKGTRLDVIG